MTTQTKEQRLAMIKAAAEKFNKKKAFRAKMAVSAAKARRGADDDLIRLADDRKKFDREIDKLNENHNCWTDGAKYAEEYYGDVMRATTRFDNDWN